MPTTESGEPCPPGFCHFPQLGEEFFRQLTAEQLITRIVKGYRKPEWQKTRERNEALDTRIYARAAASHFGIDRFQENHWGALEKQIDIRAAAASPHPHVTPPAQKPPREERGRRPGDSFGGTTDTAATRHAPGFQVGNAGSTADPSELEFDKLRVVNQVGSAIS